jgi:hypothetical protein
VASQVLREAGERTEGDEAYTCVGRCGSARPFFCVWKKKYAYLGSTEIRELRQLREERAKLKRLVADFSLDKHVLAELVRRKT